MGVVSYFRPLNPFTVSKGAKKGMSSSFRWRLIDKSSHVVRFFFRYISG